MSDIVGGNLEVGVRIRTVRTYRNMTLDDLAKRISAGSTALSRIENGGTLTVEVLASIAKALNVPVETFIGGLTTKAVGKCRIKFEEA